MFSSLRSQIVTSSDSSFKVTNCDLEALSLNPPTL